MKALGPIDQKLLSFIRAHVKAHGFSPSIKEMTVHLGRRSDAYTHHRVETLIDAGYLKRTAGRARGLELIQTKDYHLPDCRCTRCGQLRYLAQLKLVQALQVPGKIPGGVRLNGLRELSPETCAYWRVGFSVQAAPRTRTAVPGGGR